LAGQVAVAAQGKINIADPLTDVGDERGVIPYIGEISKSGGYCSGAPHKEVFFKRVEAL
jgi:hypothetical protein